MSEPLNGPADPRMARTGILMIAAFFSLVVGSLWFIAENGVPAHWVEPTPIGELPSSRTVWVGQERKRELREERRAVAAANARAMVHLIYDECRRRGDTHEEASECIEAFKNGRGY